MSCNTCGGETIQKSRARLITVGILMISVAGLTFRTSWFWAPDIILVFVGTYLLLWGTMGRGSWCRTCKRFSLA